MRAHRVFAWKLLLLPLVACTPERGAVWIQPGSTAREATIRLATTTGGGTPLPAVEVVRVCCNRRQTRRAPTIDLWMLAAVPGKAPDSLRTIRYGAVPPGYTQAAPPQPLLPGSYRIEVRARRFRAATSFTVRPDGRIE